MLMPCLSAMMVSFKFQFLSHVENGDSSAVTASASWRLLCPRICRGLSHSSHHHGAPTCIETELHPAAISTLYWSMIELGNEAPRINNTPHTPSQNQAPKGGTCVPMSKNLQGETSSSQEGSPSQCDPNPSAHLWSVASSIWRSFSWSPLLTDDPGAT